MPNVRASSGTIGTTSLPISLSRRSFASILTNTIVVEALRPAVPLRELVEDARRAPGESPARVTTRRGTKPPSAVRRSFM